MVAAGSLIFKTDAADTVLKERPLHFFTAILMIGCS